MAGLENTRSAGQAALLEDARKKHGLSLGDAFFNYVHGTPSTPRERAEYRGRFAEEIVRAFDHPSQEVRTNAIIALLKAVERRTVLVARQATEI